MGPGFRVPEKPGTFPQHQASRGPVIAHVVELETATSRALGTPRTTRGPLGPSKPSAPSLSAPQHVTAPAPSIAHACPCPTAIFFAFAMAIGTVGSLPVRVKR